MAKWMGVAALMLLPVMAACSEDNGPIDNADPGDDVAMIRLTIGQATVDVTAGGASRGVDVPRGATAIDAAFLNANGNPVTFPASSTFAIEVTSSNTGRLTFTRTGPFSGTLNGIQTGAATISVSLVHGSHIDFQPRTVNINVLPATDN